MNIVELLKILKDGNDLVSKVKEKASELNIKVIDPVPEDVDVATAEDGLYDDTILFHGQPYSLLSKENTDTQYGVNSLIEILESENNYVDHTVEVKEEAKDFKRVARFDSIQEVELHEFIKELV